MSVFSLPIFLIGPRACGKTTVGRALAAESGRNFVDTDAALQENCGRTIADIIARDGWDAFRDEESRILKEVTSPNCVISTGGGMILRPENRSFMRANGIVFYLCAPVEVLASRLQKTPVDSQRPSLTGKSITEEVAEVLAARAPLYEACARHIVDATLPKHALVRLIMHNL